MSFLTVSELRNKVVANKATSTSRPTIELEKVSVKYEVPEERYGTFKEYVIRRLQRRVRYRSFWALRDVSLTVSPGEVFGIIGRNGAGKSTLLKVVSRILRPTKGRVIVRGEVAPLLELGAGFHPELSGKENVYLNGSLLGHKQSEIDQAFDRVVEFADIGRFIHAPLRTYSTGMRLRLGFAVATAWQPDVLLLDEVMAVGDEPFQAKCMQRIKSFRDGGTTVLFVSHNSKMVEDMCERVALIDQGELVDVGPSERIVSRYQQRQDAD